MKASLSLLLVLFLSISTPVCAQLVKWDAKKQLVWSDFTGKFDKADHFDSYTLTNVNYTYHWRKGDKLLSYEFKIETSFIKDSSWVRKSDRSATLLKHEQLHFDIAELHARKLMLAFNTKVYTANYEQEIKDIYTQVMKNAREMQAKYDVETDHSKNKAAQAQWETYMKNELSKLPPNY